MGMVSGHSTASPRRAEFERAARLLSESDPIEKPSDLSLALKCGWRVPLPGVDATLDVHHPGGNVSAYQAWTRYLASESVGLIHGGYVHIGSTAKVRLPTIWHGVETLPGRVNQCEHVCGSMHNSTIVFEHEADLRLFLSEMADLAVNRADEDEVTSLTGRVLVLAEQEADCRLVQHHLRVTRLALTVSQSLGRALDELKRSPFDVVLMDWSGDAEGGDQWLGSIREAGYRGKVVALVGDATAGNVQAALDAGCVAVVPKPYDAARLMAELTAALGAGQESGAQPIHSSLPRDSQTVALLRWYVDHVKVVLHTMRRGIEADEFETVLRCCQTLRDTGQGYGFEAVTEAAVQCIKALNSSFSIQESLGPLTRLEGLGTRLSADAPGTVMAA